MVVNPVNASRYVGDIIAGFGHLFVSICPSSSWRRAPSRKQAWLCSWVILYWNVGKGSIHESHTSYIGNIPAGSLCFQVVGSNLSNGCFSGNVASRGFSMAMAALSVPTPSCKRPQRPRPVTQKGPKGTIAAEWWHINLWKTMLMFPLILLDVFFSMYQWCPSDHQFAGPL